MKQRHLTAWSVAIAMVLSYSVAGAEKKPEDYDFITLYKAYANARIRGDLKTWRKLIVTEELERIEGMYARREMEILPRDIQPKHDELLTRFEDFPIIQKRVSDSTARIVLWNDIDVEEPCYELVVIMFHREDGMWKVGTFGSVMIDRQKLKRDKSFPEDELPEAYRLPETQVDG